MDIYSSGGVQARSRMLTDFIYSFFSLIQNQKKKEKGSCEQRDRTQNSRLEKLGSNGAMQKVQTRGASGTVRFSPRRC